MTVHVMALVTARGGSQQLPRKNVLPLAGKPLVAWTIEAAQKSTGVRRVIVSTDDFEIADVAREWGAEVPFMRPPELAQANSPHIDVVQHAIDYLDARENYRPEYVLLLQPTSPLRTVQDIDSSIDIAEKSKAVAVVGVCAAKPHPFLVRQILEDGTLAPFVASDIGYLRREVLPPAYGINGAIYLNRRESLLRDGTFTPPGTHGYVMPAERSIDIDTTWDFHLAELILGDRRFNDNR